MADFQNIMESLRNEDLETHRRASKELADFSKQNPDHAELIKSIPELIDMWKTYDGYTGNYISLVFCNIGERVIPYVIKELKNDKMKCAAIYVLGTIGGPAVIPDIMEMLRDSNTQVQDAAAGMLYKIGDPVIPYMKKGIEDKEIRHASAIVLGLLGDNTVSDILVEALGNDALWIRVTAIRLLPKRMGPSCVPKIAQMIQLDNIGHIAMEEIEKMGESAAPYLADGLASNDYYIRGRCALLLGRIGSPAIPYVLKVLNSEEHRLFAIDALGEIKDNSVVDNLLELSDKGDWNVKSHCAKSLGKIGDEKAVPHLIELLKHKHHLVRMDASKAFIHIPDPSALPHLIRAMEDNSVEVCKNAATAIGKINDLSTLRLLLEKSFWDPKIDVRNSASLAVFELIENCDSLEQLENIQKKIESYHMEFRKQKEKPYGNEMHREILRHIRNILHNKMKLVKDSGILSLGTVKKPGEKDRRRYRTIRKTPVR